MRRQKYRVFTGREFTYFEVGDVKETKIPDQYIGKIGDLDIYEGDIILVKMPDKKIVTCRVEYNAEGLGYFLEYQEQFFPLGFLHEMGCEIRLAGNRHQGGMDDTKN